MNYEKLTKLGLAVMVAVGLSAAANVQAQGWNQDARQYGGSLDAYEHGYEHAYRDGSDQGRQDRERRMTYSWKNNDYWGRRSYERAFGDQNQYMEGYRAGYQAGYDDGYYGLAGQHGQLYGRPQAGGRVRGGNDPYADRQFGGTDMSFDAGYREGITLGQQDHGRNSRSNYRNSPAYRSGDLGYRPSYGDREQYRTQFRDGIARGYEDGYGRSSSNAPMDSGMPSRNNGQGRYPNNGGNGNNNGNGNYNGNGSRNAQGSQAAQGGTFTVAANVQWTPTGIRVNQGDVLRLTSSGEIRFTGNAADRAGVAGSPEHKFVSGAPLPAVLAGALIGRIDNGLPFGIGDQTTITIPASGLLYLGTNDDNVSDNSGQFQVVISTGR